jgi:hypothetical protein
MPGKKKAYIYKILFFAISVVFIIVFLRRLGELSKLLETLAQISWYFILAILALQVLGIVNRGAFYHSLYDFFGVRDNLRRFVLLSLSSSFANLAVPTAGASGVVIFVSEAEKHGVSRARATFINVFGFLMYYSVFLFVLLFGLFYLLFNHQLLRYQIITAAILFGMVLFLLLILIAAIEEAARLKKLFKFFAEIANFFARVLLNRGNIIKRADVYFASKDINEGIMHIKNNYKKLWLTIFHVFLIELIEIMILYYLFLAFGYPIYPGVLLTVYAVSVLFSVISITPGGVGFVEAAMIVALTSLSIPVELSAVVVFSYRLLTYWVPFVIGYFSFRSFNQEKINKLENGAS